ncbi:deuterolysin m35 metalloprotease, partial [Moniliophthora roreri MCA 2997]
ESEDANTFTVLAPSASVNVTHEVGNYYNFTHTGTGAFTFTPNNLFQNVNDDRTFTVIEANTSPALTKLTGQLSLSGLLLPSSLGGSNPDTHRNNTLGKHASYRSNCSSSRQTTNNQALTASATLARNLVSHLQSNPSSSSLQTTWYSTFASSRYSVTLKSFQVGFPLSS